MELVVADSESRIEQKFLPFVFERFRQAEGGNHAPAWGTRSGLSIVRNLVLAPAERSRRRARVQAAGRPSASGYRGRPRRHSRCEEMRRPFDSAALEALESAPEPRGWGPPRRRRVGHLSSS